MNCEDLNWLGYVKGELERDTTDRARAHLSFCSRCRAEVERLRGILRVLQTEEWIEPGPEFTDRVMAACRERVETVEEAEIRPVRSLREFFGVLFGRSRGTVPSWAVSAAVHLILFGALALVMYTTFRSKDEPEVVFIDRGQDGTNRYAEPPSRGDVGAGGGRARPDRGKQSPGLDEPVPEKPEGVAAKPRPERDAVPLEVVTRWIYERVDALSAFKTSTEKREKRNTLYDPDGRYRKIVEKALGYLKRSQTRTGMWSASMREHDVGVTGLALMAYLAHGNTGSKGPYRETVRKGLEALQELQDVNGRIGPAVGNYMYNHAIATIALLEAYLLERGRDRELRVQCLGALQYLVSTQNALGGWRYKAGDTAGDISVTAWVIQALRTGAEAGFRETVSRSIVRAHKFILSLRTEDGRYRYIAGKPESPERLEDATFWTTRTAMGMFSEILSQLALEASDRKRLASQADRILEQQLFYPPKNESGRRNNDLCRLYYTGLVMYQLQGGRFGAWWGRVAPELAALQEQDGAFPEQFDRWSGYGGRNYSTALSALVLQSYHRFPPLH